MKTEEKALNVAQICEFLLEDNLDAAREYAQTYLPFQPHPRKVQKRGRSSSSFRQSTITAKRRVSDPKKLRVWKRDGFRCRYTGIRLVFPQTLELLSLLMPAEFPYDNPPHGAYERTHIIIWELWPIVDHVQAISRLSDSVSGNSIENLVSASAPFNQKKSDLDLADIGWKLLPPDPLPDWDGLTNWFLMYLEKNEELFNHPVSGERLKTWHNRLKREFS